MDDLQTDKSRLYKFAQHTLYKNHILSISCIRGDSHPCVRQFQCLTMPSKGTKVNHAALTISHRAKKTGLVYLRAPGGEKFDSFVQFCDHVDFIQQQRQQQSPSPGLLHRAKKNGLVHLRPPDGEKFDSFTQFCDHVDFINNSGSSSPRTRDFTPLQNVRAISLHTEHLRPDPVPNRLEEMTPAGSLREILKMPPWSPKREAYERRYPRGIYGRP